MPNIRDVAALANVSSATVSRVLNGGPVNQATRQKIQKAMQQLDYTPNAYARGLGLGRSGVIGVIVPGIIYSYYGTMVEGIGSTLETDYEMVLRVTYHLDNAESIIVNLLAEKRVDGLIVITPREVFQAKVKDEFQTQIPMIFLDGPSSSHIDSVTGDNFTGGQTVGQHLCGLGHTRLAIIMGQDYCSESLERLAGFRQALVEHGLQLPDEYMVHSNYSIEGGHQAAHGLLSLPQPPTAIFCCNDMMALGTLQAAEDLGIELPRRLSIVGYDDAFQAPWTRPALTTVRQPSFEMGVTGAKRLLEQITQKELGDGRKIVHPVELIVRNSTAPPS